MIQTEVQGGILIETSTFKFLTLIFTTVLANFLLNLFEKLKVCNSFIEFCKANLVFFAFNLNCRLFQVVYKDYSNGSVPLKAIYTHSNTH